MGLFDKLFATRDKSQWDLLKLYSSISNDKPSSIQRERLVDTLLANFESCYGQGPDLLDIHGPYGVQKGRPIGVKRFKNLLQTKGFEKFYGLTMANKNHEIHVNFLDNAHELHIKGWPFGYQELIIGHKKPAYSCDLLKVARDIHEVFKFDYGYITQLPDNYDLASESRIRNTLGMISSDDSPTDRIWRKNTNKILTGDIKDVYPTNLLNDRQADKINHMNFDIKKFNNKISLWTVENDKLMTIREQLKKDLIINTVPNSVLVPGGGSVSS
jgi:hypothetical protein